MSKYQKLIFALKAHSADKWQVSFNELEGVLGCALPASARKYPAWWSNNPSNNGMTKIWLAAGWRTEQVDISGQTVVFRRVSKLETEGLQEMAEPFAHQNFENQKSADGTVKSFADVFGSMKGTLTFAPGVNPDMPLISKEDWDAMLAEMEAEWSDLYGPFIELPEARA